MTIKQLESYFIEELSLLYDREEAKQLFGWSAAHLSGWSRSLLLVNHDQILITEQEQAYKDILSQLKTGRPLQHIFAEAWFYGLQFKVNSAVLIPRPETEELVEWILDEIACSAIPVVNLLDIGTGSGCIAISLKKSLEEVQVNALDVSAEALDVAKENAEMNHAKVNFIHADIMGYRTDVKYSVIVSNPPYITADERDAMHRNVLDYEPHLALFVSNENPLVFYKAIADFAWSQLLPDGKLFFEINEYLGEEMVDMLKNKGFITIELRIDMQGKDRMICCSR